MTKRIVHDSSLSSGVASGRAAEDVVGVGSLRYEGGAAMVCHAGEQIPGTIVSLGESHAFGRGEYLQLICTSEVGVAEELLLAAVSVIDRAAGRDGEIFHPLIKIFYMKEVTSRTLPADS